MQVISNKFFILLFSTLGRCGAGPLSGRIVVVSPFAPFITMTQQSATTRTIKRWYVCVRNKYSECYPKLEWNLLNLHPSQSNMNMNDA